MDTETVKCEFDDYDTSFHIESWKGHDEFTIKSAAALIDNIHAFLYYATKIGREDIGKNPSAQTVSLLKHALLHGNLKAINITGRNGDIPLDSCGSDAFRTGTNSILISRKNLIKWLIEKKITPIALAEEIEDEKIALQYENPLPSTLFANNNAHIASLSITPDYLDMENPRYAPKLAAAIRAWEAVENPKGKHPAQAIREWLTRNAKELGLLNGDGTHNKLAIKAIANVINWQPKGGAPKTPG